MIRVPDTTRNVWILGGTGFIGRSLVRKLSANPANRIHLLVHKHVQFSNIECFNVVTGSLENFDLTWFERYPPDVVFHMARLGGGSWLFRRLASKRGEKANQRLAEYLKSIPKPPVLIYVSGSLMYGHQPEGVTATESTSINPSAFAREYLRAEKPWLREIESNDLAVKMVRPAWIVGPGSWFRTFYWDHYLRTGRVPVYGDGNQLMSLIHVDDLAGMISRVPSMAPDVFNLFAGAQVTQCEFTKKMAKILGTTRENITLKEVRRKFGKAEAEAIGASIPLETNHPELWTGYSFRCPDAESMLIRTINFLKSEQSVFAEAPEKTAV